MYHYCMYSLIAALALVNSCLADSPLNGQTPSLTVHAPLHTEHTKWRSDHAIFDPYPRIGMQKLLVILVDYPEKRGRFDGLSWKNEFFSQWNEYFYNQSYGQLQYDVDVVAMDESGRVIINSNNTTSYITVPNSLPTYANAKYGWDFSSKWNLHTLVRHAANVLDSQDFDWKPYIQNSRVQNVVVISAGLDYRFAQANNLPNAASDYLLATGYGGMGYITKSGAILNSYTFCNEHTQMDLSNLQMAKLGICAHEHGHSLGLPDLYDVNYKSNGVGYFDVMGYGIYASSSDGSTPASFGAWSREQLGWSEPTTVNASGIFSLGPSGASSTNFIRLYPDANNSGEYYLIENRQPDDKWDASFVKQVGSGILIWHIDGPTAVKFWQSNTVNSNCKTGSCPPHPAVILVEADNSQDVSTNTKSYGEKKDMWRAGSTWGAPLNQMWSNLTSGLSVSVVSFSGGVFTLNITVKGQPAAYIPNIPEGPSAIIESGSSTIRPTMMLCFSSILLAVLCTIMSIN